jgi:hypothetical protein
MMGTGMQKLIVVGTVVAALALVGPAFGKPALPEGYQLPSAEPGVWSPMAVKALGLRGEAMAQHYESVTGYTPQALQALGERGQAMSRYFEESTGFTPQALQALAEQSKGTARFSGVSGYTPQAVQALGERGEAMARFSGTTIVSQPANQRQLERLAAMDAHQRQAEPVLGGLDANQRQVEPSQPVVVSGDGTSLEWRSVGIGAGTVALIAALGLAGVLGIRVRSTVAHP